MEFKNFYEATCKLLDHNNTVFGYQRKNCKKHGHVKKTVNRTTKEIKYELLIEKDDNDAAKIYTFSHELAHLLNDHLDNKEITYAQKEWVANLVGLNIIDYLGLEEELKKSRLSQKWDLDTYGENYIKNRKVTEKKYFIMENQVDVTTKKIIEKLKNKHS